MRPRYMILFGLLAVLASRMTAQPGAQEDRQRMLDQRLSRPQSTPAVLASSCACSISVHPH